MLSGNKRVACQRIPSHELMYSSIAKSRGTKCGKILNIRLKVNILIISIFLIYLFTAIYVVIHYLF